MGLDLSKGVWKWRHTFHPREEYWGPAPEIRGIWNPSSMGRLLGSGFNPSQQYHLAGIDLD